MGWPRFSASCPPPRTRRPQSSRPLPKSWRVQRSASLEARPFEKEKRRMSTTTLRVEPSPVRASFGGCPLQVEQEYFKIKPNPHARAPGSCLEITEAPPQHVSAHTCTPASASVTCATGTAMAASPHGSLAPWPSGTHHHKSRHPRYGWPQASRPQTTGAANTSQAQCSLLISGPHSSALLETSL